MTLGWDFSYMLSITWQLWLESSKDSTGLDIQDGLLTHTSCTFSLTWLKKLGHLLFYTRTTNNFLIRLWCPTKSGFYIITSSVVGLRSSSKALPKAKVTPKRKKKVTVTVWWSAAGQIRNSFLNPSETTASAKYAPQITEMHRKLQHLRQALVNRKGPILHDDARPHTA